MIKMFLVVAAVLATPASVHAAPACERALLGLLCLPSTDSIAQSQVSAVTPRSNTVSAGEAFQHRTPVPVREPRFVVAPSGRIFAVR